MDKNIRVGCATYEPRFNLITLKYQNSKEYRVNLSLGVSREDWIQQLEDKIWIDSKIIGDFVLCWKKVVEAEFSEFERKAQQETKKSKCFQIYW